MPRTSLRIVAIILILIAFAAIVINAGWGGGFGPGLSAASGSAASQPRLTTTPLNAITSFDAAAIKRHVEGISGLPTVNHQCAADVTNNGALTINDAGTLARYVSGVGSTGLTGTVISPPCHKNYPTTIAVLKGDVTGQVPVITGGMSGTIAVSLPSVSATPGIVIIPVTVGNTTGSDIFSYDFQVTFDPAVLQPAATPADQTGTIGSVTSITPNTTNPGHLIISAFQSAALSGSGTLLKLRFNVVGGAGQSTALTFEDYTDPGGRAHQGFLFNEGTPSAAVTNGNVTIPGFPTFTPTSTPTSTFTPTNTATPTATNTPVSTLGNYPDKITRLSNDLTAVPDAAPTNTTRLNVSTDTNFRGTLEGDPATGVVRVTDAHPAGTYLITLRAFDSNGNDAIRTFTLTVTTVPPCNPVSFAPAAFFSTEPNSQPEEVAIGDFNHDGKQDIVTSNSKSSLLSVMLGNGMGQFGTPTTVNVGSLTSSLAIGDFNGDGKQDLAVTTEAQSVAVLLGNGTGGFGTVTNYAGHAGPLFVLVGDFNDDGKQDLALANRFSNDVSILLGNGLGGFGSPTNFAVGSEPAYLALGDFNGDGDQDLVSVNNDGSGPEGGLSVLKGNGTGDFAPAATIDSPLLLSLVVSNVNGDGKQDLIVGGSLSGVLLGDGAGGFTGVSSIHPASAFMTVGDFNGDGKLDIASPGGPGGSGVGNGLMIYLGDGLGFFDSGTVFPTGLATYQGPLAVGDFDGNGDQDVVLVDRNAENNGVWVFLRDCSGVPNITGTVTYGNSATSPSVSNVTMTAAGSPGVSTATDSLGNYTLTGFGTGAYTVTPAKTGGINGITSFDAARIAQHVTGTASLSSTQLIVADVSGNGTVTSFDAGQIARYVASLPPFGSTGTWIFAPGNRSYASVASNITGEDYSALLMGEVTGNWTNTGARPDGSSQLQSAAEDGGPERSIAVGLPSIGSSVGKELVVPVNVEGVVNKGVISYEFDLRYDPSVIRPADDVVDAKRTVSKGLSIVTNAYVPGLLRVVVYGAVPISEDGVLLNLRFTAVGEPGSVSPFTFERIMFNEGSETIAQTDGRVELF